jgi:hypothetical protein
MVWAFHVNGRHMATRYNLSSSKKYKVRIIRQNAERRNSKSDNNRIRIRLFMRPAEVALKR